MKFTRHETGETRHLGVFSRHDRVFSRHKQMFSPSGMRFIIYQKVSFHTQAPAVET